MDINPGLHVTINLCDTIFHCCRVLGISKFLLCEDHFVSVHWGGGGQVEWFNDLVFTVVRGAVSVVRSGEVINVLREEEDQVISFNLNLILCQY